MGAAVTHTPTRTPDLARVPRPGRHPALAVGHLPGHCHGPGRLLNETATKAVGFANYKALFSTADILISLRNNVIWVLVFPFVVTVIGLVLAVLTERIGRNGPPPSRRLSSSRSSSA